MKLMNTLYILLFYLNNHLPNQHLLIINQTQWQQVVKKNETLLIPPLILFYTTVFTLQSID